MATSLDPSSVEQLCSSAFPDGEVGLTFATMLCDIGWTGVKLEVLLSTIDSSVALSDLANRIVQKYKTTTEDDSFDTDLWELLAPKILTNAFGAYLNFRTTKSTPKTPASVASQVKKRKADAYTDTPMSKSRPSTDKKVSSKAGKKVAKVHNHKPKKQRCLFDATGEAGYNVFLSNALDSVVSESHESEFGAYAMDEDEHVKSQFIGWTRNAYNTQIKNAAWDTEDQPVTIEEDSSTWAKVKQDIDTRIKHRKRNVRWAARKIAEKEIYRLPGSEIESVENMAGGGVSASKGQRFGYWSEPKLNALDSGFKPFIAEVEILHLSSQPAVRGWAICSLRRRGLCPKGFAFPHGPSGLGYSMFHAMCSEYTDKAKVVELELSKLWPITQEDEQEFVRAQTSKAKLGSFDRSALQSNAMQRLDLLRKARKYYKESCLSQKTAAPKAQSKVRSNINLSMDLEPLVSDEEEEKQEEAETTQWNVVRRQSTRKPEGTLKEEELREQSKIRDVLSEGFESWHFEQFETPDGRGQGIRTKRSFQNGDLLLCYKGEKITMKEARRRTKEVYLHDCNKIFEVPKKQFCIDAMNEDSSFGCLVNHNFDPIANCNMVTKEYEGEVYLLLEATRDIEVGVELLYDYGDRSKASIRDNPWLAPPRKGGNKAARSPALAPAPVYSDLAEDFEAQIVEWKGVNEGVFLKPVGQGHKRLFKVKLHVTPDSGSQIPDDQISEIDELLTDLTAILSNRVLSVRFTDRYCDPPLVDIEIPCRDGLYTNDFSDIAYYFAMDYNNSVSHDSIPAILLASQMPNVRSILKNVLDHNSAFQLAVRFLKCYSNRTFRRDFFEKDNKALIARLLVRYLIGLGYFAIPAGGRKTMHSMRKADVERIWTLTEHFPIVMRMPAAAST